MTHNQIEFAKLSEDRRHNRVGESETIRHNRQQEGIGWAGNAESRRHNVATENVNWYTARNLSALQAAQGEAARANTNLYNEQASTERSKQQNIGADTALKRAQESYYHEETGVNAGKLSETQRHNLVTEDQGQQSVNVSKAEAVTEGYRDLMSGTFGNKGLVGGIGSLLSPIK